MLKVSPYYKKNKMSTTSSLINPRNHASKIATEEILLPNSKGVIEDKSVERVHAAYFRFHFDTQKHGEQVRFEDAANNLRLELTYHHSRTFW
jgi:hypothetical protein